MTMRFNCFFFFSPPSEKYKTKKVYRENEMKVVVVVVEGKEFLWLHLFGLGLGKKEMTWLCCAASIWSALILIVGSDNNQTVAGRTVVLGSKLRLFRRDEGWRWKASQPTAAVSASSSSSSLIFSLWHWQSRKRILRRSLQRVSSLSLSLSRRV